MQRTIKYLVMTLLAAVSFVSCDDGVTLQRYFVDHQESGNFINVDLPGTILSLDETKLNEEQQEAYNSIKRLNFLGFKANESNMEIYNTEVAKVSAILKSKKYNDLIEFSDKGKRVVVKYIGDDDEADEVIVFGSSKDMGFGIVRVLGNDMKPEQMVTLVDAMKTSKMDGSQFEGIANFFK
jgi:hypothetical protein